MPVLSPFKLASQICHPLLYHLLYMLCPGVHVVELVHMVLCYPPKSFDLATELTICQDFLSLPLVHPQYSAEHWARCRRNIAPSILSICLGFNTLDGLRLATVSIESMHVLKMR